MPKGSAAPLSGIILFALAIFSIAGINSLKKESGVRTHAATEFSFNIDSLTSQIHNKGWNNSLLDKYTFYLKNSYLNFNEEKNHISSLPGKIEKAYLQSLILKREYNFTGMFEALFPSLHGFPEYYNYYDELVFSANSAGRLSLLESSLEPLKTKNIYFDYLDALIHSVKGNYKEALEIFISVSKKDTNNYELLYKISYTYRNLGDYEKSLKILNDAVKKASGDLPFMVKATIAKGTLNYMSGNYSEAKKQYDKSLIDSRMINDRQNEVTSLVNTGIIYDQNGDVETARKYYRDGLSLAKKINDVESEAFALSELGVSYTFTNNVIEAKQNYLKSYSFYEKINDRLRLSLLSENIGKLFVYQFDYQSALKYYEKGLEYAGDNKHAQALNLTGMADVYANLSNYSRALKLYKEAEDISAQIKELSLSSQINNGLGSLNFNLNRYKSALKYFNEAGEINNISRDIYSMGDVNYKTGLTYLMIDSLELAEKYLSKSVSQTVESGDYYTEALSYTNLASLEIKKNNYSIALSRLSEAKSIAENYGLSYLTAECSIIEGDINRKQKNFDAAQKYFKDALKTGEEVNEFNIQIEAYKQLAELYAENNFNEAAESYYSSAIKLIEVISRPLFEEEEVQISYFSGKSDIYNSLADFYLKQGKYREAFEVIDRSRSRNTVQNLENLKLKSILHDDESLSKFYDYQWMLHSGIYDKGIIDSIKIQLSLLEDNIIGKHPEAQPYLIQKKALTVTEIQKALSDKENLVTIYSNENQSYIFLISNKSFTPIEINLTKQDIQKRLAKISPYYSTNKSGNTFFNQDLFSFNCEASNGLYNELFKIAISKIPENEKVIVAPSTELLTIPIELLVVNYSKDDSPYKYSNKDFLINHYSISYTPSAAAFIAQKNNTLMNENKVVVVGNPQINTSIKGFAERRGLLDEDIDLSTGQAGIPRNIALLPLKYSEEEVSQIEDIINADKVFLNNKATETNFKSNAELSRIIHLSTHSFLYNKQPVIFFSNIFDAENDGFLEAGEIVQLKLNSDLVVLSSCNSGLGTVDNAEGILGMTKAFFEAGTKSVVVSLWEVNDKYTSKFMALFYKRLSEGIDKSESLRLAKLDFIKEYSPNPYYWGAFVLSGNTSGIPFKSSVSALPYIAGLLIIIFMALTFVYIREKKAITNPFRFYKK